jgi:hypothetical protein
VDAQIIVQKYVVNDARQDVQVAQIIVKIDAKEAAIRPAQIIVKIIAQVAKMDALVDVEIIVLVDV